VVLVSVVLHGGAPMLLAQAARKRERREAARIAGSDKDVAARINATASRQFDAEVDGAQVDSQRISLDELRRLWQAKEPVTILDVRTERSFEQDNLQAIGAARMPPDHVAERAIELGLKKEAWLVAYCA
jgi:hypothetical protein